MFPFKFVNLKNNESNGFRNLELLFSISLKLSQSKSYTTNVGGVFFGQIVKKKNKKTLPIAC
jgi:hypothetical protein